MAVVSAEREIQIENDWGRVCFWTFLQFSHVTSLSGNWEAKNSANSFIRFLLLFFSLNAIKSRGDKIRMDRANTSKLSHNTRYSGPRNHGHADIFRPRSRLHRII